MRFFRRKKKKEVIEDEPRLSIPDGDNTETRIIPPAGKEKKVRKAKAGVLITSPSDLYLDTCNVLNDHKIEYKLNREKKTVKMLRSPHVLIIPIGKFLPLLARRFAPRYLRINTYTVQFDGEITHDPHLDELDPSLKKKFEKVIELGGTIAKVNWAKRIMSGMRDKKTWEDFIPYIVIGVIVFLFLFAFQIQPNM